MKNENNLIFALIPILLIILVKTSIENKIFSLLLVVAISHKLLMEIVKLERKIVKIFFKTDQ